MRYRFLDGIRGVLALFVVLHHAAMEVSFAEIGPPWEAALHGLFLGLRVLGPFAVPAFIVVSGFSLTLPMIGKDGELRTINWRRFFVRRAQRLLPAYYAAITCSLLLTWWIPVLQTPSGGRWDAALPAIDAPTIASHLLLIHNWFPGHLYRIDPPMWSLAIEWQIYFLFPLILAIHRRWGLEWMIVASFVLTAALNYSHILGPQSHPWFLTLFCFGVASAVSAKSSRHASRIARSVDWSLGLFLMLSVPIFCTASISRPELAAGAMTAWTCHLLFRLSEVNAESVSGRVLESSVATFLGRISYSLYLVHFPVLSLINLKMLQHGYSGGARWTVLVTLGTMCSILIAIAFYELFERWTHHGRMPIGQQTEDGGSLSSPSLTQLTADQFLTSRLSISRESTPARTLADCPADTTSAD